MNKEFREFLEDELYKVEKLNEDILSGYGAGVNDSYAYILKKYDEFHKPVVVPDFVAEWIKETKEKGYPLAYAINCSKGKLGKWLHGCGTDTETEENQEVFAKAWLEGYTVEEEQRYRVLDKHDEPILVKVAEISDNTLYDVGEVIPTYQRQIYNEHSNQLTEQEIKDYDERYWAFAKPVEEDK